MYLDTLWLPQFGAQTRLFVPRRKHLPPSLLRAVSFQFLNLAPLATGNGNFQLFSKFNAWALMGIDSLQGATGFQIQLWHVGQGGQRQLFNTSISSLVALGTASNPLLLTETELFLPGDSIRIQVKNLSKQNNDSIWVALWGGDIV